MSFGIVVLSHTCTLTPHQGADPDHTSCKWRVIQHPYNCNMHKVRDHTLMHKLHVSMYVAASLSNCSITTGKALVKNVERKIKYSFIAENNYKFRNCSFNLIKVPSIK